MATLDHIGLNRYIYMTASVNTMTLGSFRHQELTNSLSQSLLGSDLGASRLFIGINLYNNGPYGHSSWQQLRMSENPLHRHLRRNNLYPIVENGKERITFENGKRKLLFSRHGQQKVLDEPSIVSNYKPIVLVGTIDNYSKTGAPSPSSFRKKISLNNKVAYFTNDDINKIAGLVENEDEIYGVLKSYYLEDAINTGDSPMSSFEKLVFEQTVYPPQQYTYKSYTRARTNFTFNWNSDINARGQHANNNFHGTLPMFSSIWPLDVPPGWADFGFPLIKNLGITNTSGSVLWNTAIMGSPVYVSVQSRITTSASFGILWNNYSQLAHQLDQVGESSPGIIGPAGTWLENQFLSSGPLYSRRHTLIDSSSVVAPSGRIELLADQTFVSGALFGGEAAWDVPAQSGKHPFYNSYAEATDQMRRKGKDFTIVPEFRMSEHVPRFISSSIFNTPDTIFEITGAKSDSANSSVQSFYKIYSNSDFLKNFDVVLEDHKDFTDPSKLTLKCKAYKKLIPYDGFYPVQRTVKLAEQFYSSYSAFMQTTTASTSFLSFLPVANEIDHAKQNLLTPLFAPGVLFNTIKSGIACDYPIITGSLSIDGAVSTVDGAKQYYISNDTFDKRIPFEALIEPEKYLANYELVNNEPHASGNLPTTASWSGEGDPLYSMMADNFLAEVPNFFLNNNQMTTIASLPQSDPNFGQTKPGGFGGMDYYAGNTPECYSMRVKLYRSMDSPNTSVTSSSQLPNPLLRTRYVPPQDMIASGRKETMTMYSRPSAFGPPWKAPNIKEDYEPDPFLRNGAYVTPDSRKGFNFPFTPPYYHGQAWADISFKPKEMKKYTVSDILASSSVNYYRFDTDPFTLTSSAFTGQEMQLNASINLFSKGTIGELSEGALQNLSNLNIQVDDQTGARWIIQPKFETPILNFADYIDENGHTSNVTVPQNMSSASVPIGMWHQYGRVPAQNEGIFLQITDIPQNWTKGRLGMTEAQMKKTGSLADLCGFSQKPVKLGQAANNKVISECVVAIPFVENRGVKEFFKLDKGNVRGTIGGDVTSSDKTLEDLIDKMKRFIFPPSFDFVSFPKKINPVAMYVFEFSSTLKQQDVTDIWQNVLPDIGREFEEAEASISHSLIGKNRFINRKTIRDDIRWMVFKVKQRAESKYYDQIFAKKGDKTKEIFGDDVDIGPSGDRTKIQYNWPYDFFSLVELVKIDANVTFSDVETDDDGNETPKPKVATVERRNVQLNTLFPKGKK